MFATSATYVDDDSKEIDFALGIRYKLQSLTY